MAGMGYIIRAVGKWQIPPNICQNCKIFSRTKKSRRAACIPGFWQARSFTLQAPHFQETSKRKAAWKQLETGLFISASRFQIGKKRTLLSLQNRRYHDARMTKGDLCHACSLQLLLNDWPLVLNNNFMLKSCLLQRCVLFPLISLS